MAEELFDAGAFGKKVSASAEAAGGIRAAGRIAGVKPSTMCRAAQGKNLSVEVYFRLVFWMTGKKPWQ